MSCNNFSIKKGTEVLCTHCVTQGLSAFFRCEVHRNVGRYICLARREVDPSVWTANWVG
jgi:hypothetical protein